MKKGFVVLFLILIILTAFCISVSGCMSSLFGETETVELENADEILSQYELNVFIPVILGKEKAVESGTYDVVNASEIRVIRVVNDSNEITLLKEQALLTFSDAEYDSIYFLTAENFSMSVDGIKAVLDEPIPVNMNYSLKATNKAAKLTLDQNFSGILVYTFRPSTNSTALVSNDGADAIQIILPENTTTGSRLIGRASPAPDIIETNELGRTVLKWNAPVSSVSVKYYNENAPFYLLIAAVVLIVAVSGVFFWYRYQIKKLHKITELIDSDEESGFRKSK